MIVYHIQCKHPGCSALIEYDPQLVMHGHQPEDMLDSTVPDEPEPHIAFLTCPNGHQNRIVFKPKTRNDRPASMESIIETHEIV